VDNGSSDRTADIVRGMEEVRYLFCESPGASAARNLGAREAAGDILAFLDADCRAVPGWLAAGLKVMASESDVDGLVGGCPGINPNLWAAFVQRRYEQFVREIRSEDGRLLKIDAKNFLIRKGVFEAVGGFDIRLGNSEDADLGIRLHRAGRRIIYSPAVRIDHLNPISLDQRIRTRREQGFYDFEIFMKYPPGEGGVYYPSMVRAYAHRLFDPGRIKKKPLVMGLIFLAETGIRSTGILLRSLKAAGCGRWSFPVYKLLMDCAIFQGKLFALAVHAGYMSREALGSIHKFNRRML